MAHIEVNSRFCKGCKLCIQFCPKHIIELGTEINDIGDQYLVQTEPEKCTGCKLCAIMCPESAITVYK